MLKFLPVPRDWPKRLHGRYGTGAAAHPSGRSQKGQKSANPRRASAGLLLVIGAFLASAGTLAAQPPKPLVTVEAYEMDVAFQPEKGFLHARAGVTLRAAQPVQAVEFELNPHLTILEVTGADGRKLDFQRSQRLGSPKLSVRFAEPATGQTTLTFTYEGALPAGPWDYISKDGILLRDESRWYPSVDLAAFTENRIRISVPARWRAITSGALLASSGAGLAATYSWKTTGRVSSRSIVALPGQPETCVPEPAETGGDPKLQPLSGCYIGPHQEDSGKRMAARVHELLERFSKAFAPYPPPALLVVEGFPGERGAMGYSAPGILVVSEDLVRFWGHPGYAPEFLPHKIAHQWFPIEVTLATQEDGWLAESLAEYLAWRVLQETSPEEARRMVARAMRDALAPEPMPPLSLGLRLFAFEKWDVTHATLYQRGMLVWRTLETVIDRQRVDRALQEFFRRYAGRSASIADFRKVCEEISGRDLRWFFDYYLGGTRLPEIEIRRTPAAAPGEVAGEIVLKNVSPEFQVRVEMRLETTAGPVDHSVATRGEVTPFTITAAAPVTRFTFDPDLRILRWTEPARRSRSQRALLARLGELESAGKLAAAVEICREALALDPHNLAANEQLIHFELGRLHFRRKQHERAMQDFQSVLASASLDPMESDFNRAWARVYRARIEKLRRHPAAARAEAQAGLAMKSPALETQVTLPEAPGRVTTAAAELRALAE